MALPYTVYRSGRQQDEDKSLHGQHTASSDPLSAPGGRLALLQYATYTSRPCNTLQGGRRLPFSLMRAFRERSLEAWPDACPGS